MYQVLYRKWRPSRFCDVYGQDHITQTLKNELKTNRISHAYLFTGSRGTGKTSCAKILAKAVNCLNPVDGDPCCECENCKGIENGEIMDVVEIDAASNNGVENIRSLIEESAFTPSKAKFRVYIIDEVHMLSIGAFNALLKTLEEPPSHVVFILATTEVHKIPATILSRCQRFDFNRISAQASAKRLKFVAEQENADLDDDAALLIAALSDGALRDALSLLDRCLGENTHITVDVVRQISGLAGRDYIFSLINAVIKKDSSEALSIIDELYRKSKDMSRLCEELISFFRNLMLIKTMKNARDLIIMTDDEFLQTENQAFNLSLNEIIFAMDILQCSLEKMSKCADKRTEIEIALIKICSPKFDESNEALLSRIAALERAVKKGIAVSTVQNDEATDKNNDSNKESSYNAVQNADNIKSSTAKESADIFTSYALPFDEEKKKIHPASATTSDTEKEEKSSKVVNAAKSSVDVSELISNAKPMEDWPEVIEILSKKSRTIASAFEGTQAYISGDYILIDSKYDLTFKLLRESVQRSQVKLAIKEVTGRNYSIGPYRKNSKEAEKADPLNELVQKIKDSGIALTEE